ncbi:MAG: CPXCG motif-containing cysteine-rich protein [candidate division KSB1 bacterium]|nr:CPXCG motif-containing cysteine-rich protein [candidate division KSB1 bacterium]
MAKPGELTPAPWRCAACGQPNETLIDLSVGYKQEYVEDCAVCCRPNLITLHIDPTSFVVSLRNELEYE